MTPRVNGKSGASKSAAPAAAASAGGTAGGAGGSTTAAGVNAEFHLEVRSKLDLILRHKVFKGIQSAAPIEVGNAGGYKVVAHIASHQYTMPQCACNACLPRNVHVQYACLVTLPRNVHATRG